MQASPTGPSGPFDPERHGARPDRDLLAWASRAGSYLREGAGIAVTLGRFAARGDTGRLREGLLSLGALGREIAAAGLPGPCVCPLCGWTGPRFGPMYYVDHYREDALCYGCGAVERYRALALLLKEGMGEFFTERRRVLDVAPTKRSRGLFPANAEYLSFDLQSPHAMVHGDLTRAPLPSAGFDVWVCFHVLDIIQDDAAAMRELHRVLAPGGFGVLDHAMAWDRPTEEYAARRPEECDHVRRYGMDLPDKLAAAGFEVEVIDVADRFDAATRQRCGFGPRRFVVCRKPA